MSSIHGSLLYKVPTSLAYAVPAHMLRTVLVAFAQHDLFKKAQAKQVSLNDFMDSVERIVVKPKSGKGVLQPWTGVKAWQQGAAPSARAEDEDSP